MPATILRVKRCTKILQVDATESEKILVVNPGCLHFRMDFLNAIDTLQQQLSSEKRSANAAKTSTSRSSNLTVPW